MRIWDKICPNCGGKYNIMRLPTDTTVGPRHFKCEWCGYSGLVTELKDEQQKVRSYHRRKPRVSKQQRK